MAKRNNNYKRVITMLNKIFKAINEDYFDNALEVPTITVQSGAKARAYGWVTTSKVWQSETGSSYELNISAEYLTSESGRDITNVVATMMHECCHLYNLQNGIADCSNRGRYHNKKFKDIAENVCHLIIDCAPVIGWSVTSPSEDTLDFCIRHGFEDFLIYRQSFVTIDIGGTKTGNGNSTPKPTVKKGNSFRWQCPCCKTIVRSTKPSVNIVCGDCNEAFVLTN